MVELLAGALVGDVFSYEATARDTGTGEPCCGEFLMAMIRRAARPAATPGR